MTCIIFKDGVIASDSQVSAGSRKLGSVKKIYDLGGVVMAYCGATYGGENFKNFLLGKDYNQKAADDKDYEFEAIVINKETRQIQFYDRLCIPDEIEAPYHCLGSGAQYALGALAAGASIEQAVNIAAMFDSSTGGNVQQMRIW